MLIFPGMITVSVTKTHLCGLSAKQWLQCLAWKLTFLILSLKPNLPKSWFNPACSRVILDREFPLKGLIKLPSLESHALYISVWNHVKSVLQLAKHFSLTENTKNLSNSNPPRDFWHLKKTSSITLLLPLILLYFIHMHYCHHMSLNLNSSLRPLLIILLWMVLSLFLPLLLPWTIFCLWLKFFAVIFSMPQLA